MVSVNNMTSNNKELNFGNIVKEIFSFLSKKYRFSSASTKNWETAKFDSKNLTIEFHRFPGHSPEIFFINVIFNYRGKEISLADFVSCGNASLTLKEVDALTAPRNYPATSLNEMRDSLFRILDLIRKYAGVINIRL